MDIIRLCELAGLEPPMISEKYEIGNLDDDVAELASDIFFNAKEQLTREMFDGKITKEEFAIKFPMAVNYLLQKVIVELKRQVEQKINETP